MSTDQDNRATKQPCQPFLKWPGGKRWLAPTISKIVGYVDGTYFEPFVGGGAVFFHLRPSSAVLSDCNERLIQVYRQVKDGVDEVIEEMQGMRPGKKTYLATRKERPRAHLDRAVQFLYLNRTAFNGMYRVNQKGEFNVPYGCKRGTKVCDRSSLRLASEALQSAEILHEKFGPVIKRAKDGDVVYCDPPFTVKHDNNGFIRYNESLFSWEDQEKLAKACREAVDRGAFVVVSNAHHSAIKKLYVGFEAREVSRQSMISGVAEGRGKVVEYLLVSRRAKAARRSSPKGR